VPGPREEIMRGEIIQGKLKLEEAMQLLRNVANTNQSQVGMAKRALKTKQENYFTRTTKVSVAPFSEALSLNEQVIVIINGFWIYRNGVVSRVLKPKDVVSKKLGDIISMETTVQGAEYCAIEFVKDEENEEQKLMEEW